MGGKEAKRKRQRPSKERRPGQARRSARQSLKERAADAGAQTPAIEGLPAAGGADWGGWGGMPPA